jgi:hypothetical protein
VTTEACDLGQVQVELVLEPVDGITGATGENADKIIPGEVSGL